MGYTIIKRADHQYVVRFDGQDALTCNSRRKAAQFIAEANGLMNADVAAAASEPERTDMGPVDPSQMAEIKG